MAKTQRLFYITGIAKPLIIRETHRSLGSPEAAVQIIPDVRRDYVDVERPPGVHDSSVFKSCVPSNGTPNASSVPLIIR